MYLTEGRVDRITRDIQNLICTGREEITGFEIRKGEMPKNRELTAITDNWEKYISGTSWSQANWGEYALFRKKISIPDHFNKK